MCHACDVAASTETRRSFVRRMACTAAAVGLAGATRWASAAEQMPTATAKSGWARLITPHREWNYHRDREAKLLNFFANDPQLQYGGEFHHADPMSLADLCRSPFLFTFEMATLRSEQAWTNIREYLYRGGFLYLDNCVHVSPNITRFRRDHLERLTRLLPASEWRRLSPEHPIYRTRYRMDVSDLPYDSKTPAEDLRAYYGVFDDNRMVALVSLAHLFCGWPEQPHIIEPCMKQMANIYLYSRTH